MRPSISRSPDHAGLESEGGRQQSSPLSCSASEWKLHSFSLCPLASRVLVMRPLGSRCAHYLPWLRGIRGLEVTAPPCKAVTTLHMANPSLSCTAPTKPDDALKLWAFSAMSEWARLESCTKCLLCPSMSFSHFLFSSVGFSCLPL